MKSSVQVAILSVLFLVGCSNSGHNPSAEDVLSALDGFAFSVKFPEGYGEDNFAGLAIRRSDGSIDPLTSSNGFKAGQKIDYICFHPVDGVFKYSYSTGGISLGLASSSNFPKSDLMRSGFGNNLYENGEKIGRYGVGNSVMHGRPLSKGENFDLIFHVQELEE